MQMLWCFQAVDLQIDSEAVFFLCSEDNVMGWRIILRDSEVGQFWLEDKDFSYISRRKCLCGCFGQFVLWLAVGVL